MKTIKAKLIVVEGERTITQTVQVDRKHVGKPQHVKAPGKAKFFLVDEETGFAPENITVTRVGDDLHIAFDGARSGKPSLVIDGFYADGVAGELLGVDESNAIYRFVSTDAEAAHQIASLADGQSASLALGGTAQPYAPLTEGSSDSDAAFFGLIGLVPAAVFGAAAVALGVKAYKDSKDNNNGGGGSRPSEQESGVAPKIGGVYDARDPSRPIGSGDVSNGSDFKMVGTGKPGSTLNVIDNGQTIGTIKVDGNGNWEYKPGSKPSEGAHEYQVQEQKPGGGGQTSEKFTTNIDSTPPATPVIGEVRDNVGPNQGPLKSGDPTDDEQPTVSGKGEPNSIVTLLVDGKPVASTKADANGNWSLKPDSKLTNGPHEFTVRETDKAGNSSVSEPFKFSVDTQAPDASRLRISEVLDNVGQVKGAVAPGGVTDDAQPVVNGSGAEANSTVLLYVQTKLANGSFANTLIGVGKADANGNFSIRPSQALTEGTQNLYVASRDAAGNTSVPSPTFGLTVDTRVPLVPKIDGVFEPGENGALKPLDPTKPVPTDRPVIQGGGATPGSTVTVYDGDKAIGSATADSNGRYTVPVNPLPDGPHNLTVKEKLPNGNEGGSSPNYPLDIQAATPSAPTIDDITGREVDGSLVPIAKGGSTMDPQPMLSGKAVPGSKVTIFNNGVKVGETTAGPDGKWTWQPTERLADGAQSFTAQATSASGKTSALSDPYGFQTDLGAPTAPRINEVIDDEGPVTGPIGENTTTDDRTPTFRGTGKPGTWIDVRDNATGKIVAQAKVDASGNWSATVTEPLSNGPHTFTATATTVGGATATSNTVGFTVDSSSASKAEITGITGKDIEGNIVPVGKGGKTKDPNPTISGKADPGSKVEIFDNGVKVAEATADANGNWSQTVPLGNGDHKITAQSTAPNGQKGPVSDPYGMTSDTAAPAAPVITDALDDEGIYTGPIASGKATDDRTPLFRGTGEPGTRVDLYVNGKLIASAFVRADGSWSVQINDSTLFAEGANKVIARAVNVAGQSTDSAEFNYNLQTTPPGRPDIDSIEPVGGMRSLSPTQQDDDAAKPRAKRAASRAVKENADGTKTYHFEAENVKINGKVTDGNATKVYVYVVVAGTSGFKLIGIADVVDGKFSLTPTEPFRIGEYNFYTRAVNDAGVFSDPSKLVSMILTGGAKPDAPTITSVIDDVPSDQLENIERDGYTNDNRPTFSGTAPPDSTVYLYNNGVFIGSTKTNAQGLWTMTPSTIHRLPDGPAAITAEIEGRDGKITSGSYRFNVDTKAPDPAGNIKIWDDVEPTVGEVTEGGKTNDTRPLITGNAEPNSTVSILVDGKVVGQVKAKEDGTFEFRPTQELTPGAHTISTIVTDHAGNQSGESPARHLDVDHSAPIHITRMIDSVEPQVGDIAPGGSTNDTAPKIQGTTAPNGLVHIFDGDTLLGSTVADASGNWTFDFGSLPRLTDGAHDIQAKLIVNGQVAGNSGSFPFNVDTVAPTPTIDRVVDNVGETKGPVAPGSAIDDPQPAFYGKGERPGDKIELFDENGKKVAETTVREDGSWSATPFRPLTEGPHTITVKETDAAGNVGQSSAFSFVVDAATPAAPRINQLIDDAGDQRGPVQNDGVTDDTNARIQGTGPANRLIKVYDAAGNEIASAMSDAQGNWEASLSGKIKEGLNTLTARAVSSSGNISDDSDAFRFNLLTGTPDNTRLAIDEVVDRVGPTTGSVPKDGYTDDRKPLVKGSGAQPGSLVKIYAIQDGKITEVGSGMADATGNFAIETKELAEGAQRLFARFTNAAGNQSQPSPEYGITVDTSTPAKAEITEVTGKTIDGNEVPVAKGASTQDPMPKVSGKADPNSTVDIFDNGVKVGQVKADGSGNWTWQPSTPLTDGAHAFTAQATSAAGKTGPLSDPYGIQSDLAAPPAPKITEVIDDEGSITGSITERSVTDDRTPTFNGTAKAGTLIEVLDENGKVIARAKVKDDGTWSATATEPLTDGPHKFTAVSTNVGGKQSSSNSFEFTIDTSTPAKAEITSVTGKTIDGNEVPVAKGASTQDPLPKVSGKADPNSTVDIFDNGVKVGQVKADGNGNWTWQPSTPLTDGAHEFTAQATSAAGKTGPASDPYGFQTDLATPPAPRIVDALDDVGPVQGAFTSGKATDDDTPLIRGTGKAGTIVRLYVNGVEIGSAIVDARGNWEVPVAAGFLKEGHQDIVAVSTNVAGKQSSSEKFDYWLQKEKPGTPEIDEIVPVDDGPSARAMHSPAHSPAARAESTGKYHVKSSYMNLNGKVDQPGAAEVDIFVDGKFITRVPVSAPDFKYSVLLGPLFLGEHRIEVQARNASGVVSDRTKSMTLHVDPAASIDEPMITTVLDHNPADGIEQIPRGGTTNDKNPTIVGVAKQGQTIEIWVRDAKGNEFNFGKLTVADPAGVFHYLLPFPLADGLVSVRAVIAGSQPAVSSARYDFLVDTTAPDPASNIQVIDDVGPQTGVVPEGGRTDDTRLEFQGDAEPGSIVHIIIDGKIVASAKVDANGHWRAELTEPLSFGSHTMSTTVTDAAGNKSAPSPERHFTVDDGALIRITRVLDDQAPKVGDVQAYGDTNDATPTIEGTAPAFSVVAIYDGANLIGSTRTDANGRWSLTTPQLADGQHAMIAKIIDPSGRIVGESGAFHFNVDTVAPAPRIIEGFDTAGNKTGPFADGAIIDDPIPQLRGTAEPGSVVKLYTARGLMIGETVADVLGNWAITPLAVLPDGLHQLRVVATDAAGNTGTSPVFSFTTNTSGAVKPSIDKLIDDQGPKQGDIVPNGQTDDTKPEIQGRAKRGDKIQIWDGDTLLGETTARGDGTWSYTPTVDLTQGVHKIRVKSISPTGNVAESDTFSFTIAPDQSPVPTARAEIRSMTKDSGIETDFTTATGAGGRLYEGRVTGELQSGEKVQVSLDNGRTWQDAVMRSQGGTMRWYLFDGTTHTTDWQVQARIVNADGQSGAVTTQQVKLVGASNAPTITGIDELADGKYTGDEANAGATVRVSLGSTGAKAGDIVHLVWGNTTYDYTLSAADVGAGVAAIRVPPQVTQAQGAVDPFNASAQIISSDGATSAPSAFYPVPVKGTLPDGTTEGEVIDHDATRGFNFRSPTLNGPKPYTEGQGYVYDTEDKSYRLTVKHAQNERMDGVSAENGVIKFSRLKSVVKDTGVMPYATLAIDPYETGKFKTVKSVKFDLKFYRDPGQAWGMVANSQVEPHFWMKFAFSRFGNQHVTGMDDMIVKVVIDKNGNWKFPENLPGLKITLHKNSDSWLNDGGSATIEVDGSLWKPNMKVFPLANITFMNYSGWNIDISKMQMQTASTSTPQRPPENLVQDDTIDHLWESYTGTAGADKIKIKVDPTAYLKQKSAKILGGEGIDTLLLVGENQTLDLTVLDSGTHGQIDSVERFDLRGHGAGKILLSANNVSHLGKIDGFYASGRAQLMIEGDADDAVNLLGLYGSPAAGAWRHAGTVRVADPDTGAITEYESYQFTTLALEVLIRKGVPTSGDVFTPARSPLAGEEANPASSEPVPMHFEEQGGARKLVLDVDHVKVNFSDLEKLARETVKAVDLSKALNAKLEFKLSDLLTHSDVHIFGGNDDTVILRGGVRGETKDGFVAYQVGEAKLYVDEHINVIL